MEKSDKTMEVAKDLTILGSSHSNQEAGAPEGVARDADELSTCREIADRCVFLLGSARSSTTITLEMLNSIQNVLMLGEANFYIDNRISNFRQWYNAQHFAFHNQISKSSYAPDFVPGQYHTWWQWLSAAGAYYSLVGDKMAFSAQQFDFVSQGNIRAFFEARFFRARYIFLMRDPIQTLLSIQRLFKMTARSQFLREIDGWLQYIQLWADWVRVFPYSLTLLTDELDVGGVSKMAEFIGKPMEQSVMLLNPKEKRVHTSTSDFPEIEQFRDDLTKIFAEVSATVSEPRVLWQSGQKHDIRENDTPSASDSLIAQVPRPIGQAWALAQALRARIASDLQAEAHRNPT